ncbi:DUF4233 domain-containing protein [Cellulomonas marina]|uniref:DUF4233 domain-containing protein n=1 Tax=Cellulomonas marina TaxID=988821 RepID=A0A1I0VDP7_9CELL|nr:DUF4233 domain-containing protein [Cellulomonas marina]GIG28030.1 hypothetical protein Cma02nite_06300 [Cellulomonas marina]SFA74358.1 Protein of unknown function [Cellulomonas marina]
MTGSTTSPPPGPPPGYVIRRKRDAKPQFAQTMLLLEAFVVLFATLVASGLQRAGQLDVPAGWLWGGGLGLAVVLTLLSGSVSRRGGYALGSVAQVLVLATGVVVPMMLVAGGVFVVLWVVSLRLGGRIDRERAAFDAAHPDAVPPPPRPRLG